MENVSTLPQLQIPEVPPTECPKGNVAEIFNYFFQKYLGRATINIAGLGDVTPAKIQQITDSITEILNKIDAIGINVRYGIVTDVTSSLNQYAVVFQTPMPDKNYDIIIEFIGTTSTTAAQLPSWVLVPATKDETGFTIRTIGNVNVTSFNWTARQYPTT